MNKNNRRTIAETYAVRNLISGRLVTNGIREPLIFRTKQEALRWFRENGNPEELAIIHSSCIVSDGEKERLLKVWRKKEIK